ncbi:MAG: hypothetical protein JW881_14965 [Spirochaetales bacterium]|nr:hypothetical protein [Spirochaetales bacterium]
MENLNREIEQVAGTLKKTKPDLLPFFRNTIQYVSDRGPLSAGLVRTAGLYSVASEYLYIDIHTVYRTAFERGEFELLGKLLYSLTSKSYRAAAAFLSYYAGLSFPLTAIADEVVALSECAHNRLKPPSRITEVMSFCLSFSRKDLCGFFLLHIGHMTRYSPGTVPDIIVLIKKLLGAYPWDAVRRWIIRGTDLLTSNRVDEGVRFLLLRSQQSRWLLGITNVVLDDVRNVLKLYCASIAGREMNVDGLDTSGFSFTSPYTDGKTVFLPQEIRFFIKPEENERVYTVYAALQAASIRLATFEFDLSAIDFADELHERYGTLLPSIMENVRRQYADTAKSIKQRPDGEIEVMFKSGRSILLLNTDHEKFFYSFPTPAFARDLFTLVENARICHRLSLIYPGLREDIAMVKEYLWRARPPVVPSGGDRQAGFMAAVECLIQFSLMNEWKGDPGDIRLQNQIEEIVRVFDGVRKEEHTVQDSARISFILYNLFFDNFPLVGYFSRNDLSETFSSLKQPEIISEVVFNVSPELLKEGQGNGNLFDEESEDDHERSIDLASLRDADGGEKDIKTLVSRGEVKLFRYPEYNTAKGSYEKDHCFLFERITDGTENDFYRQVVNKYKQEYKKIRKRFLMMKPEAVEISRRWESGDEIHMTDAFDYLISLFRKTTPEEKIYFRKIRNARDIIVAILLDSSSSTLGTLGAGRIIDIEKAALCLLASALSVIDDAFGLFSFYSMGRKRVIFNIVKDFHEAWDERTQARITRIEGAASNRDGCAIRHTVRRLVREPNRTKLLILLSDGIPADPGYGSESGSETNTYAIEDTRRAIIEARKQGVIPYCITIDRFAKSYIPHLYGEYGYAIIDDVGMLPARLSRLYLKLTR